MPGSYWSQLGGGFPDVWPGRRGTAMIGDLDRYFRLPICRQAATDLLPNLPNIGDAQGRANHLL